MTTTQFNHQEDRELLAEVEHVIAVTGSYELKRLRALYRNCHYLFDVMKNFDCRNYAAIRKIARRTERRLRQLTLAHAGQAA
jgi:hypothetical protein